MTAAPLRRWADPLLDQLATCEQIPKWQSALAPRDSRLCVAYGADREREATSLARAHGGSAITVGTLQKVWPNLGDGDIAIVVVSALSDPDTPAFRHTLRALLRNGVTLWGLTGPRPNAVCDYCHDTIAVPHRDPSFLLRAHRLILDRLIASPEQQ